MAVAPKPASRSRMPWRERVAQAFTYVEDVVDIGLGVLLASGVAVLLVTLVVSFGRSLFAGALASSVVALLDQILLILMIVELLYTVPALFRPPVPVPEPFILVALIAGVRRILVLTAEFGTLLEKGEILFRNAMIELGLLTVMILSLVGCLVGLRKRHP